MFRFILFLLVVLALALLFAWVANNPGTIFLQWEWLATKLGRPGEEVGIPLTLACALLVGLVAIILAISNVLRGIVGAPTMLSRFFDNRRRERGYRALSQGLIAASSGDIDTARKLTKESNKLLEEEPLVALLGTQTALLEGKRDEARANFEKMLEDDSTRMVALRGLFLEAERQGAPEAARHYAEEAVKAAPSLPWAGNAKLRYQAADGDWDASLRTLESNRAAGLIEKTAAKRQRAVLLTAKAISEEQANPESARKLAKEAHKLANDLVPAATAYARSASRLGDIKGASKVLEATWKVMPHPELAEAYSVVRPGDSVQDRLKRARKLAGLKANHPEGQMALATAAIDAADWQLAREALEPILTTNPTERACLLMADIEEGEHGDKGRMRDWLARAVRAMPDTAWVAGNHVSDEWLPISPLTGEIDAFEWKIPVEQLGDSSGPVMTLEELKAEAVPDKPSTMTVASATVVTDEGTLHVEEAEIVAEEIKDHEVVEVTPTEDDIETVAPLEPANENQSVEDEAEEDSDEKTVTEAKPIDKEDVQPTSDTEDNTVEFPLKRRPDDPGVHPDKQAPKKGFKFF